jgi:hypothetical protein
LIRIDGYLRNKLEVGINDRVHVTKAITSDAGKVILAPAEPLILGAEKYHSEILEGQIVTKGDVIPLGVMGQIIHLVVVSTNPSKGTLLITSITEIAISEEDAAMTAMKEHIAKYKQDSEEAERQSNELSVNMSHFEQALKKIRPLSPQELNWYQRTAQEFGRNIVSSRRPSEVTEGGVH